MAVPEGFKPTIEQSQVQEAIKLYQQHPSKFTEEDRKLIEQHANFYHIPFAEEEKSFLGRIGGLAKQLGSGFVSGFSTLNVGDAPDDEYESIARNLGHLAGFVGFIPAAPLSKLPVLAGAARALKGRSVPMVVANMATKKAAKISEAMLPKAFAARAGATSDALGFLGKSQAGILKDLTEGAFHLGVASAVSSWQEGVDGMMQGFIGGAQAGAVFRGIGNLVRTGDKSSDKILRGLSASLFMGLPATIRGATTAEQIYEYVLGGYFGVKEMPFHRRAAGKHLQKMVAKGESDPEMIKGWENLDEKTQRHAQELAEKRKGDLEQNAIMQYLIAKEEGLSPEEAQRRAAEFQKNYKAPEYTEEGERLSEREATVEQQDAASKLILNQTKTEETDPQNSRDDGDTGMEIKRFSVNTENFVKEHLEKTWKGTDNPRGQINIAASAIETKWSELYTEARDVTKTNPSEPMVNFIEDTFRIDLKDPAKRYWRQQGEYRMKSRPVGVLAGVWNPYKDEYTVEVMQFGLDTNLAGNRKRLREPSKLIDRVYVNRWEQSNGKKYDPAKDEKPYVLLDSIVMHTTQGIKEVELSRVEQEYTNWLTQDAKRKGPESQFWDESTGRLDWAGMKDHAKNKTKEMFAKNVETLNRQGYYYFGGKGDASRQYFLKYHPMIQEPEGAPSGVSFPLKKVISGGQTGADQMGLQKGKKLGYQTGGTAPPNYMTETGSDRSLKTKYGLEEGEADRFTWVKRTRKNLLDSDGTVIFSRARDKSKDTTIKAIYRLQKETGVTIPVLYNPTAKQLNQFIQTNNIETLNVAGNRRSKFRVGDVIRWNNVLEEGLKAPVTGGEQPVGKIQMQLDHTKSIAAGTKTMTSRSDGYHNKFYKGDGVYSLPSGAQIKLSHMGKGPFSLKEMIRDFYESGVGDTETGIKDEFARWEGFKSWKDMYQKARPETRRWMDGHGKKHLYKIEPYQAPNVPRNATSKNILLQSLKVLKTKDKNAAKLIEEDYKVWAEKYGFDSNLNEVRNSYEKAFVSNIMYELDMNGFEGIENPRVFKAALKKVLGKNFVNNAKAFNKRAQIWFTTGFNSNPDSIIKDIEAGKDDMATGRYSRPELGEYNVVFVKDRDINKNRAGSDLFTDGAIQGRSDILDAMNKDWGMDPEGGASKSFIVAPNKNEGALLGKYMIHTANPKIQKWMSEKNIHMIIPVSAVKQYGARKIGEETYINKQYDIKDLNNLVYGIAPENFRGIFSEVVDKHHADWANLPKQMQSNLTPFNFNPRQGDAAVIEDLYHTLSRRQFLGEEKHNADLEKLMKDPERNSGLLTSLEENFESLGVDNILRGIQSKGNEKFANMAYSKIQRVSVETLDSLAEEGEISRAEADASKKELIDVLQVHEKIRAYAPDSLLGVFHKWSYPYLETSLRNRIVKILTKPRTQNSFTSRMRPYDIIMENEGATSKLQGKDGKNENLFFLDDGHKKIKIKSDFWTGTKTLGQVWNEFNKTTKPAYKKELKEILEAAVVRVPMDSISGAHVLKFGGFTGIRGYGIVLHRESMKALGGADYDGDKAFGFFGSEEYGFKKSWKDLYRRQKKEYGDKGPDFFKDKYRKELGETDKKVLDMLSNPVMQYSPYWRGFASEAASSGRDLLGPSVVERAVQNAAYASLRRAEETGAGGFHFELHPEVTTGKYAGPAIGVELLTRKSPEAMERFRGKARAMIAMTSDPMDEAGIKGRNELARSLFNEGFKFKAYAVINGRRVYRNKEAVLIGKQLKKTGPKDKNNIKAVKLARNTYVKLFKDINNRLYGRNYDEGRRHTFEEITDSLEKINRRIPADVRNTLLGKLAADMEGLEWRDKVFNRVEWDKLAGMYTFHEGVTKENKFQNLMRALDRSSMKVPMGHYIQLVYSGKLMEKTKMEEAILGRNAKVNDLIQQKMLDENGKETKFHLITEMEFVTPREWATSEAVRRSVLRKVMEKGADFVISDMSDMASMNVILKQYEALTDRAKAIEITKMANMWKNKSYLMGRNRRDLGKVRDSKKLTMAQKDLLEEADAAFGDTPISALADQGRIDTEIRQYKKNLTEAEKDFLDANLLGSVNRGRHQVLKKIMTLVNKGKKKPSQEFWKRFNEIRAKSNNTSMSRLGLASQEVSPHMTQKFMKEFSTLFDSGRTKLTKTEEGQIKSEAEVAHIPRNIIDEQGNIIKGSMLESAEYDTATKKFLDEQAPFIGLKDGTLKGEHKEVFYNLKNHLNYYHNAIGSKLNGLVRYVVGKDLNAMDLADFKNLDRYLTSVRTGTWWQNFSDKMQSKFPQISKWDYLRFPEAINRNMMRKEIELVDKKRQYKDKWGNKIVGTVEKPTGIIDNLSNVMHSSQENAIQVFQEEKKRFRSKLRPYLESIEGGYDIFEIAIREMETGMMRVDSHANFDYLKAYEDAKTKHNWNELKHKDFLVTTSDRGRVQKTGEEIKDHIKEFMETQNERVHRWLKGDPDVLSDYLSTIKVRFEDSPEGYHKGLLALKRKFVKDIESSFVKNKPFDIGLGLDGLSEVSRKILMSQIPGGTLRAQRQEALRAIELETTKTGELPFHAYFPHIHFDTKKAKERMLESIERVSGDNSLSTKDKSDRLKSLIYHYKQLTGDFVSLDQSRFGPYWDKVSEALNDIAVSRKKKDKMITWIKAQKKVRNQFNRSKEPIPGWEVSPEAYESYMKSIIDGYYRLTSEIAARSGINDWAQSFYNRSRDSELTNNWRNFMNLFVQGGMGYHEKIPEDIMANKNMKIQGTPYSWFADSTVLDRINKIAGKLGVEGNKSLPKEFNDLGKFSFEDLSRWTNMEAKYQLATLLAHPKSSVANLYGGTTTTLISTGWHNFRNARNINYLQTHVNPKWGKLSDVMDWVTGHGVVEEFLRYEADINPQIKGKKWSGFMKEAVERIKKNPELEDTTLREIWRKHGISDSLFDKAAAFMRVPERTLRRDSFVAHYLQAREKFGDGIRDYDHPFLIEMAKKGVKSTQFLYSAPFRPMFARTALGKVMTRFQLWSWNSVRFRNQVLKEAHNRGWEEGTLEFDRFKRLATTDLFTLGLSSVFMYSLFENALPAPWNWFQDTADFMFGDDKDRERAFFGAYPYPFQPLQVVTPPIARLLPPLFKGLVQDDYSKLSDYYIWTMFPFGRLGRDVFHPERGLLANPTYGIEKMTGLPYTQFARELKGKRVEDEGLTIPKPTGLI